MKGPGGARSLCGELLREELHGAEDLRAEIHPAWEPDPWADDDHSELPLVE